MDGIVQNQNTGKRRKLTSKMETKEPGTFYQSLQKKELQELCKRYGLSPYMTKTKLVNLLCSYFEKKNPVTPLESSSSHLTSLVPQPKFGAQPIDVADVRKDKESHSQTVKGNEQGRSEEAENLKPSGIQTSDDLGCSMNNIRRSVRLSGKKRGTSCLQDVFQCDGNESECGAEATKTSFDCDGLDFKKELGVGHVPQVQNDLPSTSVPHFEFHVRSEEGIYLFVDLNSNPADWFKGLENVVCINENRQKNNFGSFRQELECLGNSNKQMKSSCLAEANTDIGMNNDDRQSASSLIAIRRENGAVFDGRDEGDGSPGFSAIKQSSAAMGMSALSEEEQEVSLMSGVGLDLPDRMVSYAESCARGAETKAIDINVLDAAHILLEYNSLTNLTSDGPENISKLEDENPKLSNDICGNMVQQSCPLENPSAVYSRCSAIDSTETRLSEVSNQQKYSTCSPLEDENYPNIDDRLVLIPRKQNGNLKSADVSEVCDCSKDNNPEIGNPVCELESLDPSGREEDLESDGGHDRKNHQNEIRDICYQVGKRVLRSATRVLRRRSLRLVSKS